MATQTIKDTILTDDIDGGVADGTFNFWVDGTEYVIDLNEGNADALENELEAYRGAMEQFIANARPAKPAKARNDQSAIRAWAAEQGLHVGARGRVPAPILEAYATAQVAKA